MVMLPLSVLLPEALTSSLTLALRPCRLIALGSVMPPLNCRALTTADCPMIVTAPVPSDAPLEICTVPELLVVLLPIVVPPL
jgi:hypothetical protein